MKACARITCYLMAFHLLMVMYFISAVFSENESGASSSQGKVQGTQAIVIVREKKEIGKPTFQAKREEAQATVTVREKREQGVQATVTVRERKVSQATVTVREKPKDEVSNWDWLVPNFRINIGGGPSGKRPSGNQGHSRDQGHSRER